MCFFTVGRWMQKQKILISLKERKWAMHFTAHLRCDSHSWEWHYLELCRTWYLKEMNQVRHMTHKRKLLKDQAQQGQQLFLRTIMEFVLLSC